MKRVYCLIVFLLVVFMGQFAESADSAPFQFDVLFAPGAGTFGVLPEGTCVPEYHHPCDSDKVEWILLYDEAPAQYDIYLYLKNTQNVPVNVDVYMGLITPDGAMEATMVQNPAPGEYPISLSGGDTRNKFIYLFQYDWPVFTRYAFAHYFEYPKEPFDGTTMWVETPMVDSQVTTVDGMGNVVHPAVHPPLLPFFSNLSVPANINLADDAFWVNNWYDPYKPYFKIGSISLEQSSRAEGLTLENGNNLSCLPFILGQGDPFPCVASPQNYMPPGDYTFVVMFTQAGTFDLIGQPVIKTVKLY